MKNKRKVLSTVIKTFAMIEKQTEESRLAQTREQSIAILAAIVTAMKSIEDPKKEESFFDMVNGELQHVMKKR
jgi:hypothetical protein